MRLVFLGPPGVGKGTQARQVAEGLGIPHVATGNILRDAVQMGTPLGGQADAYMKRGALVPDAVVIGIIEERLKRKDCGGGFLLDGFPRTLEQGQALKGMLDGSGLKLDRVIYFTAPREAIVERLSGRRTCTDCGTAYHVKFDPPPGGDVCGQCGGRLVQRADDAAATITQRLEVYEKQTAPLAAEYRRQGILEEVAAGGTVTAIFDDVMQRLRRSR